jgi:hypothetical protein
MLSQLLGAVALVSTSALPDSVVLRPQDVPVIASVAIEVALRAARRFEGGLQEPVGVDVEAGHATFEQWSKQRIAIDTASWLLDKQYGRRATFDALECPIPGRITPACRFRESGTLVRVWRVELAPDGQSLSVFVDVMHARGPQDSRLGGLTAVVNVVKENGTWRARQHRLQVP